MAYGVVIFLLLANHNCLIFFFKIGFWLEETGVPVTLGIGLRGGAFFGGLSLFGGLIFGRLTDTSLDNGGDS